MSEAKTVWLRDAADVPEGAEVIDNSSREIKCWRHGSNYYYYIHKLPFNPDQIDVAMGGDKVARI